MASSTSRPSLNRKCKNFDVTVSNRASTILPEQQPPTTKSLPLKRKNSGIISKNFSKKSHSETSCEIAQKENDNDMLTKLPSEILAKIFDQVSFDDLFKLEQVNKRLRDVTLKLVWPKKEIFDLETLIKYTKYPKIKLQKYYNKKHSITNKSVEAVLSRANIKHLDLTICNRNITSSFCSGLNNAPHLTILDLKNITMSNKNLDTIAKYNPLLEKLTLIKCFKHDKAEMGLKSIFTECKNLTHLNISQNSLLVGVSFVFLPPQLIYLNIAYCDSITSNQVDIIAEKAINLETIILTSFQDSRNNFNNELKKLIKLRFFQYYNTICRQPLIHSIDFSHLKNLEIVNIDISNFTQTLESLEECPKLRALNLINDVYDENDNWNREFEILKRLKNLKFLKLNNFYGLKGLVDLVQSSQIQYLSLQGFKDVSDEIIKELITECNSLTHLELLDPFKKYDTILLGILTEELLLPRSNILKLVINKRAKRKFPPCKWCEIILCEFTSPFDHYTNVENQYHTKK